MGHSAGAVIRRYLKATGWNKMRFAEVCGVHHSAISHVLVGRRGPSLTLSLQIVRGTQAACVAAVTTVPAITMEELSPQFAALAAPVEAKGSAA